MKRFLLASAATVALGSQSALAQDFSPHGRIDEFVGINVIPEAEDEVYNLGVGTSLDIPFTDTIGVQLDAAAFAARAPNDVAGVGTGTVTVYYRNDQYGVGVFGSGLASEGVALGGGGLTGLYYTEDITYFGQIEALDVEGSSDPVIGGGLGGTYFLTDNTALTGTTAIGFSTGATDDVLLGLGLGAEHRFSGSPLSVGAGYTFGSTIGDDATVAHSAQVTLSYHFGTSSLKDESRNGPGFFGGFTSISTLIGF